MDVILTEVGSRISASDLQTVEQELDVIFPSDYKAFLLKNNGGIPEEDIQVTFVETDPNTQERYQQGCDIQFFSELGEIPGFYENLIGEELIPPKYLSIASDSFGNELLLCADGSENDGKVYFGNHELYDPETEQLVLSLIAESFTQFMEILEPLDCGE